MEGIAGFNLFEKLFLAWVARPSIYKNGKKNEMKNISAQAHVGQN